MGCRPEVDSVWSITWPPTEVSKVATRKCPGGSEVTGVYVHMCMYVCRYLLQCPTCIVIFHADNMYIWVNIETCVPVTYVH